MPKERVPNRPAPLSAELEKIGKDIVDCAFVVHSRLGPGLLEHVYEVCLAHELTKRGYDVERQLDAPLVYDNIRFDAAFRIDLLVNDKVIVEVKSVLEKVKVHRAQVLTHLRLTEKRLGYLINFNVPLIREGIDRIIL